MTIIKQITGSPAKVAAAVTAAAPAAGSTDAAYFAVMCPVFLAGINAVKTNGVTFSAQVQGGDGLTVREGCAYNCQPIALEI